MGCFFFEVDNLGSILATERSKDYPDKSSQVIYYSTAVIDNLVLFADIIGTNFLGFYSLTEGKVLFTEAMILFI